LSENSVWILYKPSRLDPFQVKLHFQISWGIPNSHHGQPKEWLYSPI